MPRLKKWQMAAKNNTHWDVLNSPEGKKIVADLEAMFSVRFNKLEPQETQTSVAQNEVVKHIKNMMTIARKG